MKRRLPPPGFTCCWNLCRFLFLSYCFTLSFNDFFFTQAQEKFSLLSREVFTLTFQKSFHPLSMFSDVLLRFVRVWRCLWAGPHKHFKGPRLHQQGQGYQASALWLPSHTEIKRSTGWHKWTSWRRFWTSTSASLWRRNSGAPSLSRWHLKKNRKLLWSQEINVFFFFKVVLTYKLAVDVQYLRNRPLARRKDIFLKYFSFLFCLGLAGGPNSWQVNSFLSLAMKTLLKIDCPKFGQGPKRNVTLLFVSSLKTQNKNNFWPRWMLPKGSMSRDQFSQESISF